MSHMLFQICTKDQYLLKVGVENEEVKSPALPEVLDLLKQCGYLNFISLSLFEFFKYNFNVIWLAKSELIDSLRLHIGCPP